jgi:hypothetical protein
MSTDAPPALTAATLRRMETTRARAREAVRRLDRAGHPITFAAVADAAKVSRSLLYSDPALRTEIETLRTTRPAGVNQPPVAQRGSDDSLHQRLAAALDDNHALRAEIQLLRDQLAITLGEQRAATIPTRPRSRTIGPCS